MRHLLISAIFCSFFLLTSCGQDEVVAPEIVYFTVDATFHEQYGEKAYTNVRFYESDQVPSVWGTRMTITRNGVVYDLTQFSSVIKKCSEEDGISITLWTLQGDVISQDIDRDGIPEEVYVVDPNHV